MHSPQTKQSRNIQRKLPLSIKFQRTMILLFSLFHILNLSLAGFPTNAAEQTSAKALESIRLLVEHKHPAKALEELKPLLDASPKDGVLHYYRALCLHYLGRTREAVDEYGQALALTDDATLQKRCQDTLAYFATIGLIPNKTGSSTTPASTAAPGSNAGYYLPNGVKVVCFYNAACKTCKAYAPIFNKVKEHFGGRPEFINLDLNAPQNKRLVNDYQTEFYPTTMVLDAENKEVARTEGALEESELENFVNKKLEKCLKKH